LASATTQSSPAVRKKVLLLYPFYWPHYKAGGPVQSLFNLVSLFQEQSEFFLIASDKDIDGSTSAQPILLQEWTKGPNNENIFFTPAFSPLLILRLIRQIQPDVVLLNGIFNIRTTLPGLVFAKWLGIRIVISPRGMLQGWALKRNPLVKKAVLLFLRMVLKKNEAWHATDGQEKADIQKHFGGDQKIYIASNVPRKISPFRNIDFPAEQGKIRLVFLSLINSNKNLDLVIDAVNQLPASYSLDIYGPVIDQAYWERCKSKITDESTVVYKGPIPPWEVPSILPRYHFFVLPTQGENFGHAIFDALSCGLPVIISRNTPWQDIEEQHAGFYIDLTGPESLVKLLQEIAQMPAARYQEYRLKSLDYATNYWKSKVYHQDYEFLIGNV
jgi:glycosyltransferase involved in cell wall biosynthesis